MNGTLFGLAIQGVGRKKRSSLLLFSVLLLSFAFSIILLFVTGSIRKTNEEYRAKKPSLLVYTKAAAFKGGFQRNASACIAAHQHIDAGVAEQAQLRTGRQGQSAVVLEKDDALAGNFLIQLLANR